MTNSPRLRASTVSPVPGSPSEAHHAYKSRPLFEVKARVLREGEATREGLLAGLAWLKANMKPHDLAVIFYAGHGESDAKKQFYLLPQDVDVRNLPATAVSGEVLKEHLADLPGKVLLLLDACHSGGRQANNLARDLAGDDTGVVVMCAALGTRRPARPTATASSAGRSSRLWRARRPRTCGTAACTSTTWSSTSPTASWN